MMGNVQNQRASQVMVDPRGVSFCEADYFVEKGRSNGNEKSNRDSRMLSLSIIE